MAEPKWHPTSFTGPMVRAILDDLKGQTRRVATQHNSLVDGSGQGIKAHWPHLQFERAWVDPGPSPAGNPGPYLKVPCRRPNYCDDVVHRVYPRWQVGDRLWVRETWTVDGDDCAVAFYRATDDHPGPWKPSIYMPRSLSRIPLEVTGVRAERVQEISEEDALAEGITRRDWKPGEGWSSASWARGRGYAADWSRVGTPGTHGRPLHESEICLGTARWAFANLWDSINAKRGYGWDANPWVWVLEFRRLNGEE